MMQQKFQCVSLHLLKQASWNGDQLSVPFRPHVNCKCVFSCDSVATEHNSFVLRFQVISQRSIHFFVIFSTHVQNLVRKSSTQNAEIERFFLVFDNLNCPKCESVRSLTFLTVKFLSPNYSKFAVECD